MVFSYVALAKLGAIPALVNTSLRSQSYRGMEVTAANTQTRSNFGSLPQSRQSQVYILYSRSYTSHRRVSR